MHIFTAEQCGDCKGGCHGIRKDMPFSIRLYNATEIKQMLERVGLVDWRLLGEDGQPVTARSRRMIVIARKPLPA